MNPHLITGLGNHPQQRQAPKIREGLVRDYWEILPTPCGAGPTGGVEWWVATEAKDEEADDGSDHYNTAGSAAGYGRDVDGWGGC